MPKTTTAIPIEATILTIFFFFEGAGIEVLLTLVSSSTLVSPSKLSLLALRFFNAS